MEMISQDKDVYKEVLTILSFCNKEIIEKIPSKVINKLMELSADSNVDYYLEKSKKLKEQNISEESKDLISLIFYSYIAKEKEKKELLEAWNKNEKSFQEEIRKKYNTDELFKHRASKEKITSNSVAMVEYKESIFTKIQNWLKRIF